MSRGIKRKTQAAIAISVVAFAATDVVAQTANSPVGGSLTFKTTADVNTNPGLTAVSAGTTLGLSENLGFSFRTQTRTQLLELFGSAGLSLSQPVGGASTTTITQPKITLHYFRESANSNLDLSTDYWTGDVTSAFDADPTSAVAMIVDTGTLAKTGAAFSYNWGITAPLGFSVNASYNQNDYTGITNPNLFDSTTMGLGISANMRLSPSTQATLTARRTEYVSSDAFATSSDTMNYSFNVSHDLSGALTMNTNIGYRDRSTTASGVTTTSSGYFAGAGITQALPRGSVSSNLKIDAAGSTTTTSLSFGRTVDLPDGSLSASVSADWSAGSAPQFLGSATYTKQFSDGSLSLDLKQSLTTDNLGQDIKLSNLGIAYQKALNSVAGINLSLSISQTEDGGAGAIPTQNRATFSASYSQAITPDWDLSVGYSHRRNAGSAIATADSDSIFLTLMRDVQFGF